MLEALTAKLISIHALREEGDHISNHNRRLHNDFYPRPPRGGRLLGRYVCMDKFSISIHALREEGDAFRSAFSCVEP